MGPAGLTAVFGMGTGVTPPVWSPENRPADGQATPAAVFAVVGHNDASFTPHQKKKWHVFLEQQTNPLSSGICQIHIPIPDVHSDRFGEATMIGSLYALGAESRSGWSSCLAVRTGRLRRSPAVHARPIDLVVFQEPVQHLLRETSSRRGLRA